MNLFVRNHARTVSPGYVVAQRLKRTPSIRHKLNRFPSMLLSRMQDIGGCRLVLKNLNEVRRVEKKIRQSRARHKLVNEKDYISEPKESGYRGIHLIYRYHSDTYKDLCGLMVEIQIRTQIQHLWATGVETVGTFLRSSLKSSIGPDEWLEFFSVLSKALHWKEEEPKTYVRNPDFLAVARQLGTILRQIDADRRLAEFGNIIRYVDNQKKKSTRTYVLHLQPLDKKITVYSYRQNTSKAALTLYSKLEQDAKLEKGEDVVLVNTRSVQDLRRAYPNYFMDTKSLVKELSSLKPYMGEQID